MSNPFEDYLTTQEAAKELGIEYPTLMARIRKGKIEFVRNGWSVFVHKDEIARVKRLEGKKNASNKNMEERTR